MNKDRGEEPQEEGLMGKLESEEKKLKHVWIHIDSKKFKDMVYGYFAEGYIKRCKFIYREIRKKYKVDGHKIELGDIYALKKKYLDEEPENRDEKKDLPVVPPPEPNATEKVLLDKMYTDAKERLTKNPSDKAAQDLIRRLEDRMLGKEAPPMSIQDRVMEASLKRLEGTDGSSDGTNKLQEQMQKSMLSMMEFQTNMMEQMSKARGQGLSSDPGVALAQVVVPTIQEGFHDVNDTIREVGGIRPKERKLRPEDQQKVDQAKQVLQEFESRRQEYMSCPNCSYVIPKRVAQCSRCGVIFEPSKDEVVAAATEQKTKGKEFVQPKTPDEIARMREAQATSPKPKKEPEVVQKKGKFPENLKWLEEWFAPEGKLDRLRYKIERNHDPKQSMSGAWSFTYSEEQKKLLFVATKGMDFLLKAAEPYIDEFGQRGLYDFFKTSDAKIWMVRAFNAIRDLAKAEGISLTPVDIDNYEKSIKPYLKKEEEMQCGLCDKMILLSKWDEHSKMCQKEQLERMEKEALEEADKKIAEEKKKEEQTATQKKVE